MNRVPVENVDKVNASKLADKATADGNNANIDTTYLKKSSEYVKSLSISGKNITVTKGDSTTSTLTTQDTTYTLPTGNASAIGGLKLSDAVNSTSSTDGGIAATPKAVKDAYDRASAAITNASNAANNSITALSIDGKIITYTKGDGTTDTITTQDTDTTYTAGTGISISSNTITNTGVTSVNGSTGAITGLVKSVNGTAADAAGNVNIGSGSIKIPYATCSTAFNTTNKVATITNDVPFALEVGAIVLVRFTADSSMFRLNLGTLNVNSTGAKTISDNNTDISFSGGSINYAYIYHSRYTYLFIYDGTNWNAVSTHTL